MLLNVHTQKLNRRNLGDLVKQTCIFDLIIEVVIQNYDSK